MPEHHNVTNERDVEWHDVSHGERFGGRRKFLGDAAGGEKLGCSLYEVPPGRRAYPRHYHRANEEAIYVLEGSGKLRIGAEEIPLQKGDYAALPTGEEWAHQLVNTSDENLVYLCLSTKNVPDVMVYPDSGKVGIFDETKGPRNRRTFIKYLRMEPEVDYYDGEE